MIPSLIGGRSEQPVRTSITDSGPTWGSHEQIYLVRYPPCVYGCATSRESGGGFAATLQFNESTRTFIIECDEQTGTARFAGMSEATHEHTGDGLSRTRGAIVVIQQFKGITLLVKTRLVLRNMVAGAMRCHGNILEGVRDQLASKSNACGSVRRNLCSVRVWAVERVRKPITKVPGRARTQGLVEPDRDHMHLVRVSGPSLMTRSGKAIARVCCEGDPEFG